MNDKKWTIWVVMNLLLSASAVAQEASEPPLLDQTPTPAEIPFSRELTILSYSYTSFNNFTYENDNVDFEDTSESEGSALHTIGLSWRNAAGGGAGMFFGFSDPLESSGVGELYGGFGMIEASLKRYEFDLIGFSGGESGINVQAGLKYIQTNIAYDFTRISGDLSSQSFEVTNHYFGFLLGLGGNHPLFNRQGLVTLFWSAQGLGLLGLSNVDELQYESDYYYWDYDQEMTGEGFFAGGLNGAVGLQVHLGDNVSLGAGYKGQYIAGGDIVEKFHGLMALAMIRF